MNKEIGMEEWEIFFLRGKGEREEEGLGEEREGEEELGLVEVERAIRKLKKGKAAGEDGIQNKAWLWGGQGEKR